MKKTSLKFLIATSFLALTSFAYPVYAQNSLQEVPNSKDYNGTVGTHLIVNVIGVNSIGDTIISPSFMEFSLSPDDRLTKIELLKKVQQVIDSIESGRYKVTDFEKSAKVTYKGQTYPITEKGFIIPDFTKTEKNPAFLITGKVLIEILNSNFVIEDNSTTVALEELNDVYDVHIEHEVIFLKKVDQHLVPIHISSPTEITGTRKIGFRFTAEELFVAAEALFEKSEAYKEGYQLIKRLSTTVIEDFYFLRDIYNIETDISFNYVINSRRSPNIFYTESISERYYISKNNDDYESAQHVFTINFVNKENQILSSQKIISESIKTSAEIAQYISQSDKSIVAKNGSRYSFSGDVSLSADKEYQAIFTLEETDEVDVAPVLPEDSIDEEVAPSLPVLEPLPVDDIIIAPTIPIEPAIENEAIIDFSKVPDFEEDSYGPYPNMQGQYGSNQLITTIEESGHSDIIHQEYYSPEVITGQSLQDGDIVETIEESSTIDTVEDSIDASPISGSHEGLVTETIEETNLIDIVEDSIDASPISGSHDDLVTETIEESNLIDIVEDSIDASPISGSHEGLVTETIEDTNLAEATIKDTIVKEPKGTQANQSMELPKTGEVNSVLSILLGMFTIAISGMLYKKKD